MEHAAHRDVEGKSPEGLSDTFLQASRNVPRGANGQQLWDLNVTVASTARPSRHCGMRYPPIQQTAPASGAV